MANNFAQTISKSESGRLVVEDDWYPGGIPSNVSIGEDVYIDSAFSFATFYSEKTIGFHIGYASGNYHQSLFKVGKNGVVDVGSYVVLENTNIICNFSVKIGSHCMLSWGSTITDSWLSAEHDIALRRAMLERAAKCANRHIEHVHPQEVILHDNVWVGFDSVIMPGVTIGANSVIGCKSVVFSNVPPNVVFAGNPAKFVKNI